MPVGICGYVNGSNTDGNITQSKMCDIGNIGKNEK